MSFSAGVKRELSEQTDRSRHCNLAELAAILSFEGHVRSEGKETTLIMDSDNPLVQKKYFTLLHRTTNISEDGKSLSAEQSREILMMLKMLRTSQEGMTLTMDVVDGLLLQQNCCRRAFVRGAFLAAGSISDPNKNYHFEIVCRTEAQADQLQMILQSFEVDAKIVERKKHYVVYLKEGAQIVEMLGLMGAHVALMDLENVRILKEMRNSVNRKVNCETANITKTVSAAVRQVEDIEWIEQHGGLSQLPESLREIARVRLEHPDMPLKELGALMDPPLGKSGVNHRLRRISEIASRHRG